MNKPLSPDFGGEPESDPGSGHSGNGNNGRIERRLTALETRMEFLATKEDVAKLEKQILALENKFLWRVGGLMLTGIIAIAAILRYLTPD